jgi:D-alanine-D-alanine ligase
MWRLAAGASAVAGFRFDDRIEGTGGLFCLEANTQPGITETSLVPELAAFAGHNI